MSRWYRAYEGTVTDAKLHEAAMVAGVSRSVAIATWHAILESCAVSKSARFETTPRRIAVILCEPLDGIVATFAAFVELGLLLDGEVCAWAKRQFDADNSTERSRRHREAKRNADATLQQRSATPPYTETDTEIETTATSAGAPSQKFDQLESQLREAANAVNNPSPSLFDISPIIRCLNAGASLELDVLPTIKAMSARRKPISTWRYTEQAIMDAMASRLAPPLPGNVATLPRGQPPPNISNNRKILNALDAMDLSNAAFPSQPGPMQIGTSRPVFDVLDGGQG